MLILEDEPGQRPRKPVRPSYPPVLIGLASAIVLASLVQFLAPAEVEEWMYEAGAIIGGDRFEGVPRPFGVWGPLVLHLFLHGGILHLGFNIWALMSFGTVVARWTGPGVRGSVGFLAFFAFCGVGGGLAQMAVFALDGEGGVAIGASSAISGLLPALGWLQGGWRRAVGISVPWLLINLALAAFGAVSPIPIAWAAHLGGLAAGFMFPVFFAWGRA